MRPASGMDCAILYAAALSPEAELTLAACRIWLEAWNDVLRILDKAGMESIEEFYERFCGTQSLFKWIQDLESELWNAGLKDRQFLRARIEVSEEGLRRFRSDDELLTENRRRGLAESYYELGETDKTAAVYREWSKADPGWGWDVSVGPTVIASRVQSGRT